MGIYLILIGLEILLLFWLIDDFLKTDFGKNLLFLKLT